MGKPTLILDPFALMRVKDALEELNSGEVAVVLGELLGQTFLDSSEQQDSNLQQAAAKIISHCRQVADTKLGPSVAHSARQHMLHH